MKIYPLIIRTWVRCSLFSLCLVAVVDGRIDFAGDGVSEIWRLKYSDVPPDSTDFDGDGVTNFAEAIAGTDPKDGSSFFGLGVPTRSEGLLDFRWPAIGGKQYRLERLDNSLGDWVSVMTIQPVELDLEQVISIPEATEGIFRMVVSDIDVDGDGLTAWEESQLGWSDQDERSSSEPEKFDFAVAIGELEKTGGTTLAGGEVLAQRLPTRDEASRFLIKASFGPTKTSIPDLCAIGYAKWLENQIALPRTLIRFEMFRNGISISSAYFRQGLWRAMLIADDQLRQRVAYALSQILVIDTRGGNWVGDNALTHAVYYDHFVRGAFGPYRDVLEDVVYSPAMGFYLSHLKNRKSDASISRFPDENFAREIMQLFTIGLWELNPDGSHKLDLDGLSIPTYDNDTITEMAKVFTGMSFSTRANGTLTATSFFDVPGGNDFQYPMLVWDEEHEPGPKAIINDVFLDGTQTGDEEVQAAIDGLVTHSNIAPFISRLLIQRLVTSNPSPSYLARVSAAWNTEVDGQTGHLDRVIEAIFLDPEALGRDSRNEFKGKVREPIIRVVSLMRAFDFKRDGGSYFTTPYVLSDRLGQFPTLAPTVFNFYLPEYSPPGEFRLSGYHSPEMQLATSSQLMRSDSHFSLTIEDGDSGLVADFTDELALAGDAGALVDHVSEILTGSMLGSETRQTIITALESEGPEVTDLEIVQAAVYLVSQSMECVTIK